MLVLSGRSAVEFEMRVFHSETHLPKFLSHGFVPYRILPEFLSTSNKTMEKENKVGSRCSNAKSQFTNQEKDQIGVSVAGFSELDQ